MGRQQQITMDRSATTRHLRFTWLPSGKAAILLMGLAGLLGLPDVSWALQVHEAPEGFVAHQLAHIFFAAALALMAYWLEANRFVQEKGWRLIQAACLLLLLWNVVAFCGHWVTEKIPPDLLVGERGTVSRRLLLGDSPRTVLYYYLGMDHLVCVPAILCLYLGIKTLYKQIARNGGTDR